MNPGICFKKGQVAVPGVRKPTSINDLPPEVRVQIWKYLTTKDHCTIRQLCKQFRAEIDQIVGIHAVLRGRRLHIGHHFVKTCLPTPPLNNPEAQRSTKENIEWLKTVAVRSLKLSRIHGINFEPIGLINNEYILRHLDVKLGTGLTPKLKVMTILRTCHHLEEIKINLVHDTKKNQILNMQPMESWEYYRKRNIYFVQDILTGLATKSGLKKLKVRATLKPHDEVARESFLGKLGQEANEETQMTFPIAIRILKLDVPMFSHSDRSKLSAWKALLEQQKKLVQLKVNLGFVHWSFFANFIHNNIGTLRKLNLRLSNWAELRDEDSWLDEIPVADELDWRSLLSHAQYLTFLKVVMSSVKLVLFESKPYKTWNFRNLELTNLLTFECHWIALESEDFLFIFQKLPNLKNVNLKYWTGMALTLSEDELTDVGRTSLLPIFQTLVEGSKFESITLVDMSILRCPEYLRALIDALPGYNTLWPEFGQLLTTYSDTTGLLEHVRLNIDRFSIKRKPES